MTKTKLSPTSKRLLRHFAQQKTLSIKSMWMLHLSNPAREVGRCVEKPFNILLDRKRINWRDEYSSGYYYEYSLNKKDLDVILSICKSHNIVI